MSVITCSDCGSDLTEQIQPSTGQLAASTERVTLTGGDWHLWRCPVCPPAENGIYRVSVWP